MDAVAVNEEGITYFFKGDHLFKGFHGKAELSNATFPDLDDHHHIDHVDAAFRMHYEDHPEEHDHMFFFLDEKVFCYDKQKLEEGYPKNISEVFPGIPDNLDAAVECPKPECDEDSVIFFKDNDIFHYIVKNQTVDKKEFESMPNCSAAFRFMEHYYCFHGHKFSKFNPKTGEVLGNYPKEARNFFHKCSKYGKSDKIDHEERERCSRVHLDALSSDNDGDMYAFRGQYFIVKVEGNDTVKADTIENAFRELNGDVDAVFSYDHHFYMMKDDHIYVYKMGEPHTLLDGFPKTLKEELGFDGHADAAFVCDDQSIVHIIQGNKIFDVDLKGSPRAPVNERPMALFKKVDAAICGPGGIKVIVGNHFYNFPSVMIMVSGRALPEQHRVSLELFGCDH